MRFFARRRSQLTTLVRLSCLALTFLGAIMLAPAARADEAAPQTVAIGDVLRGHFVQDRRLAGFAKPLRSEGSFVLVPGTGLIWQGEKPFANTTVITSGGIVQLSGGQEAMRLPASRLPGLSRLYDVLGAALSGNIAPLRQTFDVTRSAEGDAWQIVLTPRGAAAAQLKSLKLAGRRFVDAVDIDHGGGDMDHINFLDQNVAPANLSAEEKSLLHTLSQ